MTQSRREKTELCAISVFCVPLWSIRIWEVLKTGLAPASVKQRYELLEYFIDTQGKVCYFLSRDVPLIIKIVSM